MNNNLIKNFVVVIILCFVVSFSLSNAFAKNQSVGVKTKKQNGSELDNYLKLELNNAYELQTFKQCLPFTLQETVKLESDGTTYIVTGDIPAMWVRDSSAQILPYVYMCKNDETLKRVIRGTILRHIKHFNSKYQDAPFINSWQEDYTPHEYKWEPDGVASLINLAWLYWKITGDDSWAHGKDDFDAHLAFTKAIDLLRSNSGFTGMIKCKNRPSDDWTEYPYLIPTNMYLSATLPKLAEMDTTLWQDTSGAKDCNDLSKHIRNGINTYGKYEHPFFGTIWAYEVDGIGNALLMDDANIPSLLSAPYLEFCLSSDPIYQNTRKYILSNFNPYYFTGLYANSIGSPHTQNSWVWPISIIMQALTSDNDREVQQLLKYLDNLDNSEHYMHESVNPNNPTQYTRKSFAWANSLYAELIIKKVLGLSLQPDIGLYIKPYLNPECNKVALNNPVYFGRTYGITLHLTGEGSKITAATINGKPAEIDQNKGVRIPSDKADVIIYTTPAMKHTTK